MNQLQGDQRQIKNIPVFYRETWMQVNLSNVAHNVKMIRNHLNNDTQICAVVKANGYGHGAVQIAKQVLKVGVNSLAVATLGEAVKLRQGQISAPILVMGWIRPEDSIFAADLNISVTVFQTQWIKQVKQIDLPQKLKIHLKLDTGMGRLGIRSKQQLDQLMKQLEDPNSRPFILQGIFTHFSTADQQDLTFYRAQTEKFDQLTTYFMSRWAHPVILHVGNSAASIRFPHEMKNSIRFGVSLYGIYPSEVVQKQQKIELKPVMSLYSKISHIKRVQKGQTIGYGRQYIAKDQQWIATIPIGYADGIPRNYQGQQVLIQGQRYQTVGRVCMDQMMIKVDRVYPVGTKVVIIGTSGQDRITVEQIAKKLGTINYQVLCLFGQRIPRRYIRDSQDR